MAGLPGLDRLSALTSLGDANRRRLYEYVLRAPEAVSRDAAGAALGLARSTASFHLDRLVRDGLLAVEFRKLGSKEGPGSGRPAKLYRPAVHEVAASVPDRHYDLAGEIMASAIELSATGEVPVLDALLDAAFEKGTEAGNVTVSLEGLLAEHGYAPEPDGAGGTVLLNCPFHRLSRAHTEIVCAMNESFLAGAAASCGVPPERIAADTAEGHCCARIRPAAP